MYFMFTPVSDAKSWRETLGLTHLSSLPFVATISKQDSHSAIFSTTNERTMMLMRQ
jgi:hypothetical protein